MPRCVCLWLRDATNQQGEGYAEEGRPCWREGRWALTFDKIKTPVVACTYHKRILVQLYGVKSKGGHIAEVARLAKPGPLTA